MFIWFTFGGLDIRFANILLFSKLALVNFPTLFRSQGSRFTKHQICVLPGGDEVIVPLKTYTLVADIVDEVCRQLSVDKSHSDTTASNLEFTLFYVIENGFMCELCNNYFYMYMYVYICIYVYVYLYVCCMCVYVCVLYVCMCVYMCVCCMCVCVCICMFICVCIYVCICVCICVCVCV